jgi:hypothetical protein
MLWTECISLSPVVGSCTYGNELMGSTERDTFLRSSANISFSRWTQNGGRGCNNALICRPYRIFYVGVASWWNGEDYPHIAVVHCHLQII